MIAIYQLLSFSETQPMLVSYYENSKTYQKRMEQQTIRHPDGMRARYIMTIADPQFILAKKEHPDSMDYISLRRKLKAVGVLGIPSMETLLSYEEELDKPAPGHAFSFPYAHGRITIDSNISAHTLNRFRLLPGMRPHEVFEYTRQINAPILKYERIEPEFLRGMANHSEEHLSTIWPAEDSRKRFVDMYRMLQFMVSNNASPVTHHMIQDMLNLSLSYTEFHTHLRPIQPDRLPAEIVQVLYKLLKPTAVGKRRGYNVDKMMRDYFGIDLQQINQNQITLPKRIIYQA